mgnify:CR=1 FL=1
MHWLDWISSLKVFVLLGLVLLGAIVWIASLFIRSQRGTILIHDARTGEKLCAMRPRGDFTISCVVFLSDRDQIVTGDFKKELKIWNVQNGKLIRSWKAHKDTVNDLACHPQGTELVTGGADNRVKIWEASSGKHKRTFKGHTGSVSCVDFSSDGKLILSGSYDSTVKVWNAKTGEELHSLAEHTGKVMCAAFSADGSLIVSGAIGTSVAEASNKKRRSTQSSPVGEIIVWSVSTGESKLTFNTANSTIRAVAFSPDARQIFLGGSELGTVQIYNAITGEEESYLAGHTTVVTSLVISPDDKCIAGGSQGGSLIIWETSTEEPSQYFYGHTTGVTALAFSSDGRQIVSCSKRKRRRAFKDRIFGDQTSDTGMNMD